MLTAVLALPSPQQGQAGKPVGKWSHSVASHSSNSSAGSPKPVGAAGAQTQVGGLQGLPGGLAGGLGGGLDGVFKALGQDAPIDLGALANPIGLLGVTGAGQAGTPTSAPTAAKNNFSNANKP